MRAPILASLAAALAAAQQPVRPESMAPRSPAEEAATFHLPPGYRLELVASEPLVVEPVLCTFDGDGHLFVAEMRTYVQDVDGKGTDEPRSRIVRLSDRDGDGAMDEAVTFADGLVLPRMVLPLDDRVLVMATYDGILWCYRDQDRDGRAESREVAFEYGRSGANLYFVDMYRGRARARAVDARRAGSDRSRDAADSLRRSRRQGARDRGAGRRDAAAGGRRDAAAASAGAGQ